MHRSYVEPCTTLYMYCDTVISWCRCMMFIMHVRDIDVPEVILGLKHAFTAHVHDG